MSVALSLNNLAETSRQMGDYSKAISLFTEALEMQRRIYKDQPNHPDIANSLMNLGNAFSGTGDTYNSKALELLQSAFDIWKRAYKDYPDNPDIALCSKYISRVKGLLKTIS